MDTTVPNPEDKPCVDFIEEGLTNSEAGLPEPYTVSTSGPEKYQYTTQTPWGPLTVTVAPDMPDYSKYPYFIKKAEEANEFLRKHPIPEHLLRRDGEEGDA